MPDVMATLKSTFKFSFKKLLFPIILLVAIIIAFLNFSELKEIWRLFREANGWWLLAALGSQIIAFLLQGWVYYNIFELLGFKALNLFQVLRASVTVIFLNFTIPSLGFAGNIYFLKILKKCGMKEGCGLLTILMEFLCFYLSFIVLLIISFAYLFFHFHALGRAQLAAIGGFVAFLIILCLIIYFWLGNKKRARKRILWFAKKIRYINDGDDENKWIDNLLHEFYHQLKQLKHKKTVLLWILSWQFIRFLWDSVTIYVLFLAFNVHVPFGLAILAPNIARLFGLLSFIPGGVGTYEGSLVLILNSLGIKLELSLAIMLLYRFFSYWLYFPLGLTFFRQLNKIYHEELEDLKEEKNHA